MGKQRGMSIHGSFTVDKAFGPAAMQPGRLTISAGGGEPALFETFTGKEVASDEGKRTLDDALRKLAHDLTKLIFAGEASRRADNDLYDLVITVDAPGLDRP